MLLAPTLIALLFVSPVFADNLSLNDPFRVFSLQATRRQKTPICCLKPLSPIEPVEDQILLSFEEWKVKQWELQEQQNPRSKEHNGGHSHGLGTNGSGHEHIVGIDNDSRGKNGEAAPPTSNVASQNNSPQAPSIEDILSNQQTEGLSPHFRVPLTDRFNYANLDCSARVHTSHRSAKSPYAVLSSKRDRYMLSPCNQKSDEKQFIVVELCEDIRIDTVQLANFEFFSGVFKDFSVRVAKTYTMVDEGWVDAGTYQAKNNRGIQSFHPPTSLRDFYRYIRIDFHSHYGNEYYCPVSLLRVYGLTHLEEWKWEIWEAESRAKLENYGLIIAQEPAPLSSHSTTASADGESEGEHISPSTTYITAIPQPPMSEESQQAGSVLPLPTGSLPMHAQLFISDSYNDGAAKSNQAESPHPTSPDIRDTQSTQLMLTMDMTVTLPSGVSTTSQFSSDTPSDSLEQSLTNTPWPLSESTAASRSPLQGSVQSTASISSASNGHGNSQAASHGINMASPAIASQPVMPATTGESIYRTIMNRLVALETNHTLYARYIEQQNNAVREVLKRLGEDVGRLEGISRAQAQAHQRLIQEWKKQRLQLRIEYRELLAVVEYLSDEIVLEKRLGIAQLCLLLAVLVFIALTRGSRGEPLMRYDVPPRTKVSKYKYMKEWGRRHLSLSIDQMKSSNSDPATESDIFVHLNESRSQDESFQVYKKSDSGPENHFLYQIEKPQTPVVLNIPSSPSGSAIIQDLHVRSRKISDSSRSRTPSFRTSARRPPHHIHLGQHISNYQRALTPTKSAFRRPLLQRSNSHSMEIYGNNGTWSATVGIASRSAKKWARSAHLHEVRTTPPASNVRKARKDGEENRNPAIEDVFSSSYQLPRIASDHHPDTSILKSHQRNKSSKDKATATVIRNYQINVKNSSPVIEEISDGDQWEDTDSIAGEGYDC
ncbi:hypothetical protein AX17_006257 [Amanita inopinata Kibby_2008]|nr:hypothetical protein AX17_006257 [Amanita inopinata Kibby_2008]